jgi:alpha-L-rhamnosidase
MNSFNHYAYGAVGTWMVENITGIRSSTEEPGFKHIILQLRIGGGITWAREVYRSPYGLIESHWTVKGDSLTWGITIPPNTTATAHIPAKRGVDIIESDCPAADTPGVELVDRTAQTAVFNLDSGVYKFFISPQPPSIQPGNLP